jgi:hypothetical protein
VEHTLTERSILANTSHPFILALRYAFQTEHKLYMVSGRCADRIGIEVLCKQYCCTS